MTAAQQPDAVVFDMLDDTTCVLLGFDGPMCSVFAGSSADSVAAEVLDLLDQRGHDVPSGAVDTSDPLRLIAYVASNHPELAVRVEAQVAEREREAIVTAEPTSGAEAFLRAVQDSGRGLAIVSNNAYEAVEDYLQARDLDSFVDHTAARLPIDSGYLKPDPRLILRATEALHTPLTGCTLIGDSAADIHSAQAVGIRSIGYANEPAGHQHLTQAGADAVVTSMDELTLGL